MYERIDAWRNEPIKGKYPYVYLDGISLKRTWGGEVRNVAILVAVGVGEDGFRDILGVAVPEVRRLREMEKENARLKRLVAERDLEIDAMKEVLKGNF